MHMENGLLVDITQIGDIVRQADVFAVGFRLFPERLIVDARHNDREIPMVAIVDPVESLQERYFWFGQHRPSLGIPEQFQFFFWPHSVPYLEESGLWGDISRRVERIGFAGARETCDAAILDLIERERKANVDAILGRRFQTIWSASQV
jgi:hypothetical protein